MPHNGLFGIYIYIYIYNSANLFLSFCDSISFSIYKKTLRTVNFKLDQCVALNLTMCLLYLSVYGCCQLISYRITDLSGILYAMLLSAIPTTVAHSAALLADDTGRS